MSFFDDVDAEPLGPAEQTYANQTNAREAYARANAAGPPQPAPPQFSEQAMRDAWAGQSDHSPAALARLGGQHGVEIRGDTVILPDGRKIDAVMDEGGRDDPGWIDLSAPGGVSRGSVGAGPRRGGGGGRRAGGGDATGAPSTAPSTGASTFSASTSPLSVPAFTEEFKYDPWTRKFEAPKGEDVFNDPGYQFRLQQGQQALERAAAARGTLNTGGTLKDVSQFGQGLASQEYGQAYGRKMGEYQSDYGDYLGGYGRALGEFGQRAGLFGQNYQRGLQGFQAAQQAQAQEFGQGFDLRQLAQNESQFGRNLGYNYANLGQQESQFGRNLGYHYAGLGANVIQQGARYANPEYTAGADATAAGKVGSANAWQGGLSGIANLGQDLYAGWGSRDPSQWKGVPYAG